MVRSAGARGVAGKVPRRRGESAGSLQDSFEKYNTASAVLEMTRRTDPTMFNTVWSVIPWGRLGPMGSACGQAGRAAGVRTVRATGTPGGTAATVVGAGVGALTGNAVLGGLLTGALYPVMYRKGRSQALTREGAQAIGLKRQAELFQTGCVTKSWEQREPSPKPRPLVPSWPRF